MGVNKQTNSNSRSMEIGVGILCWFPAFSPYRIPHIVFRNRFMFEGELRNSALDRSRGGGNTAER